MADINENASSDNGKNLVSTTVVDDVLEAELEPMNPDDDTQQQCPVDEMNMTITPRVTRIWILTVTQLENLVFSGIIFGWPALVYLLKTEHVFENYCVGLNNTVVLPAVWANLTKEQHFEYAKSVCVSLCVHF